MFSDSTHFPADHVASGQPGAGRWDTGRKIRGTRTGLNLRPSCSAF